MMSTGSDAMRPTPGLEATKRGESSLVLTRPRPRISLRRREQITGLLSVAPAFILVGVVVWFPIIRSFRYSVTDWNGASAHWIGLTNYRHIIERGELWKPLKTNLIFFASIPGILLISL